MAADSDSVEKPRSSSASENLENLKSELSLRIAEAAKRSERRGEFEIQRLKLYAEVADFDERLAKLQKDAALTAGQKTIHRAYLQHLRGKILLSIRLMQLEQDVEGARFKHTVSKTPGAEKNWHRQQQMRRQGAALGGGHPTRRQVPLPVTKGPEEEALGELLHAESEYRDAKAKLDELRKKDSYFESLIGGEPEECEHASRASGQVLAAPHVNPSGVVARQRAVTLKARRGKLPPEELTKYIEKNRVRFCDRWPGWDSLTAPQLEAASLRWECNLPVNKIAGLLGINRKSVDERLNGADQKITAAGGTIRKEERKAKSGPKW